MIRTATSPRLYRGPYATILDTNVGLLGRWLPRQSLELTEDVRAVAPGRAGLSRIGRALLTGGRCDRAAGAECEDGGEGRQEVVES